MQIVTLPVTEALIERECTVQVRKWRESRGELTHQPGRRLHGTRAIYEYKRRAAAISSGGSLLFLRSSVPPPGPLRSSSSLLSLPGFRKSKAPFQAQKKGSFSGPSGMDAAGMQQLPPAMTPNQGRVPNQKPPIPPAASQKAAAPQSPLIRTAAAPAAAPAGALSPYPKIVSEQITPTIPSPTANNAPLPPLPDPKKETADTPAGEEEGKKRRSKEDKKKEKEDEKKKVKEKKEKEKAEKERIKKEKERLEKEKKKGGKKKDKGGGGETEEKN